MSTTTDNTYAAARADFNSKYRGEKYEHGEYYVAHDWDGCEAHILTPSGEVEWVGWCEDVTGDAYIDDMVDYLREQAEQAEQAEQEARRADDEQPAAPRLSDDARRLVEDRLRAAVDHCITEWDVEPSAVLEILQQLARDEADFQRDLQPTLDDARRADIGAVLDKYARD